MDSMGISTDNTRLDRYEKYLESVIDDNKIIKSKIFTVSEDNPFKSETDWLLYVLREIHELMWILKGLESSMPIGIKETINMS